MRISDWSSDVCSSDLFDFGGSGFSAEQCLGAAARRALAPDLVPDPFDLALQVGHIVVQVADGQRAQIGAAHATPGLRRIVLDNPGEAPIPCVRLVILLEQYAILAAPLDGFGHISAGRQKRITATRLHPNPYRKKKQ